MQPDERIHRDIYANRVNAHVSTFDFAFDFELTEPSIGPEDAPAELVARVRVSPQLAKAFAQLLQRLVQQYEDEVGPVPLNPEVS